MLKAVILLLSIVLCLAAERPTFHAGGQTGSLESVSSMKEKANSLSKEHDDLMNALHSISDILAGTESKHKSKSRSRNFNGCEDEGEADFDEMDTDEGPRAQVVRATGDKLTMSERNSMQRRINDFQGQFASEFGASSKTQIVQNMKEANGDLGDGRTVQDVMNAALVADKQKKNTLEHLEKAFPEWSWSNAIDRVRNFGDELPLYLVQWIDSASFPATLRTWIDETAQFLWGLLDKGINALLDLYKDIVDRFKKKTGPKGAQSDGTGGGTGVIMLYRRIRSNTSLKDPDLDELDAYYKDAEQFLSAAPDEIDKDLKEANDALKDVENFGDNQIKDLTKVAGDGALEAMVEVANDFAGVSAVDLKMASTEIAGVATNYFTLLESVLAGKALFDTFMGSEPGKCELRVSYVRYWIADMVGEMIMMVVKAVTGTTAISQALETADQWASWAQKQKASLESDYAMAKKGKSFINTLFGNGRNVLQLLKDGTRMFISKVKNAIMDYLGKNIDNFGVLMKFAHKTIQDFFIPTFGWAHKKFEVWRRWARGT